MHKKTLCLLISLCMFSSLCGCWNYRGLNQMALIAGIAIDKTNDGLYHLSLEVVDVGGDKTEATRAKLIECEGDTILSAIRNAKRRFVNKLYISHSQVIIISRQIAQEDGILSVIDLFLRDSEIRETCKIVISQEVTAKSLLSIYGMHNSVVAFEIREIIDEDSGVTASARAVQVYEVLKMLKSKGNDLTLPAFHLTINDDIKVVELAGTAVFKDDKLVGWLDTEESKHLLFAVGEINGGMLTLKYKGDNVALEIKESETSVSFSQTQSVPEFSIKIEATVFISEYDGEFDSLDKAVTDEITAIAEKMLADKITALVSKAQVEYNSDIFGFGNIIYKKDLKLWQEISDNWYDVFRDVKVNVSPKIKIVSSSLLKKT